MLKIGHLSGASVAAVLAVAAIGLTPQAANAQEVIKIGVLLPFTGPWAKNGNEAFVAMEIARNMINEPDNILTIPYIQVARQDGCALPKPGSALAARKGHRPGF